MEFAIIEMLVIISAIMAVIAGMLIYFTVDVWMEKLEKKFDRWMEKFL